MNKLLIALALLAVAAHAQTKPIPVKVVVVAMFERGEDTGDAPGEYQYWVEREHLDKIFPMPASHHAARMNDSGVLGIVTGIGTAKAAASIMALGLDARFDLTKAYWVVAGIGGGDPADVSLGSAVWAERVLDGDLAYEVDARDIPKDWPTGMIPLRRETPYEQPVRPDLEGELYTLNPQLVDWAYRFTKDTKLADTDQIRRSRARFEGFPVAQRPPFVTKGDTMSSSTFWHGTRMDTWANEWTKYYTKGAGNYMISAMEDSGTMQSITFLSRAGKVDKDRVLVLRTVSNYDREAPGSTPAESLKGLVIGAYSGYLSSLEAAWAVGSRVVHELTGNWEKYSAAVPR